ncbi:glycosyltransferase involved in cell wall biosynthesis [Bacillus pakistanensis]|uniref:Glycosyltransferase involved in cell wall biosynthesis n=1 Tax=Rossellomorea pakistanensis TaxID=992288 RepID=A0ABS2NGF0_9BACI|nr:glycosyltransferase [Bacillus pakistanensis]MBM7586926.1 glycosyltransferase involved in cell wall biosynthesis [Bacillus pakistanensis]
MKVSIIIPFYNCPYVDQAINSALNQSYKNIEVILVDDGSTQYVEKIKPYLNRIKYLKKANGGTASALNHGIRHATGQYFAWLSSDDIFLKDKVERQLAFMNRTGALISYTAFTKIDANNNVINHIHYGQMNRADFMEQLLRGCPINGCTVMIDINLLNKVGMFDVNYKYSQDYEMWCRMLLHTHIYYYNEPLTLYRVHNAMGSVKYRSRMSREEELVKYRYNKYFQVYKHKYK